MLCPLPAIFSMDKIVKLTFDDTMPIEIVCIREVISVHIFPLLVTISMIFDVTVLTCLGLTLTLEGVVLKGVLASL